MNLIIRIALAAAFAGATFVAAAIFWELLTDRDVVDLDLLVPAVAALAVGAWAFRATGRRELGTVAVFLGGSVLFGVLGFTLGFFGPMLLAPGANQGPMLGIFITGPGGFILGGPIALVLRHLQRRKHARPDAAPDGGDG